MLQGYVGAPLDTKFTTLKLCQFLVYFTSTDGHGEDHDENHDDGDEE